MCDHGWCAWGVLTRAAIEVLSEASEQQPEARYTKARHMTAH